MNAHMHIRETFYDLSQHVLMIDCQAEVSKAEKTSPMRQINVDVYSVLLVIINISFSYHRSGGVLFENFLANLVNYQAYYFGGDLPFLAVLRDEKIQAALRRLELRPSGTRSHETMRGDAACPDMIRRCLISPFLASRLGACKLCRLAGLQACTT